MRAPAVPGIAVVAIGVLLAACAANHGGAGSAGGRAPEPARAGSSPPGPLAAPPVPAASLPVALPDPGSVSYSDPTAVSRAAVIIQWTMDTVTDASQYQAELRSAPFLAPAYLAALRANPPVTAPGYQWDQWAAHHAFTTVSLVAEHDDQPADTTTTADRQWGITVTPHGSGGWLGTPVTATVFVQLTRAAPGQPWLVSRVLVSS